MISGRICFLLTRHPTRPDSREHDKDKGSDEILGQSTPDMTTPLYTEITPNSDDVTFNGGASQEAEDEDDYQQFFYLDDASHPGQDETLLDLRVGQHVILYLTVSAIWISVLLFLGYSAPGWWAYYRRRRKKSTNQSTNPLHDLTNTSSSSDYQQQQQQFLSAPATSKYARPKRQAPKPPAPHRPPQPTSYFSSLWSPVNSGSMLELQTLPSSKLFDDPSTSTFCP